MRNEFFQVLKESDRSFNPNTYINGRNKHINPDISLCRHLLKPQYPSHMAETYLSPNILIYKYVLLNEEISHSKEKTSL